MSENVNRIIQTANELWDAHQTIPSGMYRRDFEAPNFYVYFAPRLQASRAEVHDAIRNLARAFTHARVNSRSANWDVFDHNLVSHTAAFWTLESGRDAPNQGVLRSSCVEEPVQAIIKKCIGVLPHFGRVSQRGINERERFA